MQRNCEGSWLNSTLTPLTLILSIRITKWLPNIYGSFMTSRLSRNYPPQRNERCFQLRESRHRAHVRTCLPQLFYERAALEEFPSGWARNFIPGNRLNQQFMEREKELWLSMKKK